MRKVPYRHRQKNIRETMQAAWEVSRKTAADPGLRETYSALPRAPIDLIGLQSDKFANHGGILRIAEAFRLNHVFFEAEESDTYDFSAVRGAHHWIEYEIGDPLAEIARLKEKGYRIVALHLDESACAITSFEWQFPCAIVYGEEKFGVPDHIAEHWTQRSRFPSTA